MVNAGVRYGVVQKAGSWFSYNGEKIGQGIEGSRQFLKENPKIEKEIAKKIRDVAAHEETAPMEITKGDEDKEEEAK